jgi:hypothetical protein
LFFEKAKSYLESSYTTEDILNDPEHMRLMQLLINAPYPSENGVDEHGQENDEGNSDGFIALMNEMLPEYNCKYYPENEFKELLDENPYLDEFGKTFQEVFASAEQNDPDSIFELAKLCCYGVEYAPRTELLNDYGTYLFYKSILGGCKKGLSKLGFKYWVGEGVEVNYEVALLLFNHFNCVCVYNCIGSMYANGQGVKRSRITAYKYFVKYILLGVEDGFVYDNMTVIYPYLKRFEKDDVFISFLEKKFKELEKCDDSLD